MSGLPQTYEFEHLSPDGDTVLGSCGTFGRWDLTGKSGFLGDRSLGLERGPISAQGVGFAGSTGMRTNNPSSHHYWAVPHPSAATMHCALLNSQIKPSLLQAFLSGVVFTTVRKVIGTSSLLFTYANAKSLLE